MGREEDADESASSKAAAAVAASQDHHLSAAAREDSSSEEMLQQQRPSIVRHSTAILQLTESNEQQLETQQDRENDDDVVKSRISNSSVTTRQVSSGRVGAFSVSVRESDDVFATDTTAYDSGFLMHHDDDDQNNAHLEKSRDFDGDLEAQQQQQKPETAPTIASLPPLNSSVPVPHVEAKAICEDELEKEMKERILGSAVEATAVRPSDKSDKPKHKRKQWAMLVVPIVVVLTVAVIVGIIMGGNRSSSPSNDVAESPTASPTPAPTLSPLQENVMELLVGNLPTEMQQTLDDKSSPQYQAFLWLSTVENVLDTERYQILQKYALATFYYATNGNDWVRNDGWLDVTGDPCVQEAETGDEVMFGVSCLNEQTIRQMSLPSNSLKGTLPLEFSLLEEVLVLDLSGNQLQGALNLNVFTTSVQFLRLGSNSFTGTLSSDIGKMIALRELDLESNPLNGTLPAELGQLFNLESINLENNLFDGDIPTAVGQLTKLTMWNSRDVPFNSSIPAEMGQLTALTHLELSGAFTMTGTIPESLYDLTNLEELRLTRIGLHGTLSPSMQKLSALQVWEMGYQHLSGSLPTEIGLMTSLQSLRIPTNFFTGTLPSEMGDMTSLQAFTFRDNMFTGTIPPRFGNLSATFFDFVGDYNQLTGSVPNELGVLSLMKVIRLNDNDLTGTMPQSMYENYQDAFIFTFHNNQMSGTLPLSGLWRKNLDGYGIGTNITGTIPTEIGLAPNMKELYIHSNQLSGTVPTEIAFLTSLKAMAFADNALTGSLPEGIGGNNIDALFLQRNMFSGLIPDSIGSGWTATKLAYFHGNELTGSLVTLCENVDKVDVFADCAEVDCPCCSHCCDNEGVCTWTGVGEEKGEAPIAPFRAKRSRAPGANRTDENAS